MRRTVGLALAWVLLAASGAAAHERSLSHSTVVLDGRRADIQLTIGDRDLTRLPLWAQPPAERDAALRAYLVGALRLYAGADACAVETQPSGAPGAPGRSVFRWSVRCDGAGDLALESHLLAREAPGHLHFARVQRAGGAVQERILVDGRRRFELPTPSADAPAPEGPGFGASVRIGAEHIASGVDHLAFLLALLLVAATLGEVAWVATGFTIAHSVTLALAVLGWVRPDAAAVEALIGLSIAIVAAENAWLAAGRGAGVPAAVALALAGCGGAAALGYGAVPAGVLLGLALFALCYFAALRRTARPARLRVAVSFLFGLVHGFGFAGILADIELPPARLVPTLAGFNIGVELGQLVIIGLLWPLLWLLARRSRRVGDPLRALVTAGLCGLGLFWFVTRSFA